MWLRWQSPALTRRAEVEQAWSQAENWAREPSDIDRAGEVRVIPLNQWRVLYFADANWREATPGDPQDTETQRPSMPTPDGVRLMLTLPPGGPLAGAITLDWVNPRVSPRRS
jgi:general secretion pathway protein J